MATYTKNKGLRELKDTRTTYYVSYLNFLNNIYGFLCY